MSGASFEIEFVNTAANRRRYVFERRQAGGWLRVEEEFDGEEWHSVGEEIVSQVSITVSEAAAAEIDVEGGRGAIGEVTRGP